MAKKKTAANIKFDGLTEQIEENLKQPVGKFALEQLSKIESFWLLYDTMKYPIEEMWKIAQDLGMYELAKFIDDFESGLISRMPIVREGMKTKFDLAKEQLGEIINKTNSSTLVDWKHNLYCRSEDD